MSTACHRKRPKKEKERAGYLGTPYESVISRLLDPQRGGWSLSLTLLQGLRLASFIDKLHAGSSGGAMGEGYRLRHMCDTLFHH